MKVVHLAKASIIPKKPSHLIVQPLIPETHGHSIYNYIFSGGYRTQVPTIHSYPHEVSNYTLVPAVFRCSSSLKGGREAREGASETRQLLERTLKQEKNGEMGGL